MIHHRHHALDADRARCGHLIRSIVIDGGLMLSLTLPVGPVENTGNPSFSPNAFFRIDRDGEVFLTLPYVEGEQDGDTLIPFLVAEELEVTPGRVHLEQMAPCKRPSSNATPGAWAAGKSSAIRKTLLREACATTRAMLIAAAARRWDADARCCHAHEGEVIHTTTWRKLSYGELAAEAARIPIPESVELKAPATAALRLASAGNFEGWAE